MSAPCGDPGQVKARLSLEMNTPKKFPVFSTCLGSGGLWAHTGAMMGLLQGGNAQVSIPKRACTSSSCWGPSLPLLNWLLGKFQVWLAA